jgi:peroxiredoxin
MRLSSLSLIAAGILSAAGLGLVLAARPSSSPEPEPRHPITDAMRREAATRANSSGPTIDAVDTEGDRVELAKLAATGPVFLIFIMDSCPCSIEAQPYFQRLYDGFGQKVPFVGITDGNLAQGKEWKAHFQMIFPLISDPKKELMKAFGAKHSAYSALVGKGGRVVQLWPGYNQSMLTEMKAAIAREAGLAEPAVDVAEAPTKPTSGCVF